MTTMWKNMVIRISVLVIATAALACGGFSVPATPLPGEALPPIPTDPPQVIELPTATPGLAATATPSPAPPTPVPTPVPVRVERPDWGFAVLVPPDWLPTEKTNGVLFSHPVDSRVWFAVYRETYSYSPAFVDEQVSRLRLEDVQVLDPNVVFYEPYPHPLGSIRNGRASDYIYIDQQGSTIYGSVTVGTTLDNITWTVQWEAPAEVYPEFLEGFVQALAAIEIEG